MTDDKREHEIELGEIKKDMHTIQELMEKLVEIVDKQEQSIEGMKVRLEELRSGHKNKRT